MVVQNIFILSLLITNVLSAPSSCIESCDSYIKQYQTQTSSSFQKHVGLLQSGSHLPESDYSKPGKWSEHNDYNIDNEHGKLHEEQGQYVKEPKTVRYYKKNYTFSHSTSYPNDKELLRLEHQNNKHDTHIPTQNSYNKLSNTESISQQYKYRMQNQQYAQSLHGQPKTQSERLEDLEEYSGGALQTAQSASDLTTKILQEPYINTQPVNWSMVNSYKTDGQHGRAFEELGQYVLGDKNVRYYKRNYSSNYSSSDGTPIHETIKTGMQEIQNEIEKHHKTFGKKFNYISSAETIGSSNIGQIHVNTHGLPTDSIYNINNNDYKERNDKSILSGTNHNEEQQTSVITNRHLSYRNPYQNNYGTNSYSTYKMHEAYEKKFQPTSQFINPTQGYTRNVLTTGDRDYKKNIFNEPTSQQLTDNLESKLVRNQMFLDDLRNSGQTKNRLIQTGIPGHTAYYKEHWTSINEESIPHQSTDISNINQHSLQYNNNQYENSHNLHQGIQQEKSNLYKFAENGFNNIRQTSLEKSVAGTSDISEGVDVVDSAYNSQYSHNSSQYQTRYKRNANYDKQEAEQRGNKHYNDDSKQETVQSDYLMHQTSKVEKIQQNTEQAHQTWKPGSANQRLEDLTQKTDEFEDLTQQTTGNLEFGQESQQSYQTWKPGSANQRLEDLTQKTNESDDRTQQTAGNIEFGQESQQSYQPWKLGVASLPLGDLMQTTDGSDDFSQQTAGNLEFNQASHQVYQPWKPSTFHRNQQLGDMTPEHDLGPHSVKPAVKPKPRSRYSRFGTPVNVQISNTNAHNIDIPNVMNLNGEDIVPDIYELPPEVGIGTDTDNSHNTNAREDQMTQDVVSKNFNQQTGSTGYDIEGGNVDQVNLLHKSNDATVGLQWHYTYHPSDQRQFVQQTDQKNKESLQQQSKVQFTNLESNLNQEIQNKYTANNPHRQLEKQSENYAFGQGINPIERTFNYDQTENKLIIDQQLGENGNLKKYVTTAQSEPKLIPKILETYGGGQYDPTIGDDIYSKVTINPSATLSSINNMDSWDIREKPEVTTTTESTPPPLPIMPFDINDTTEAPQSSSFWSRVGHKITVTFGKAKEKAKNIFG